MTKTYIGLILAICMISTMFVGAVSAHENDQALSVKINNFFELNLPSYDAASPDCNYKWVWTYDNEHISIYTNEGNLVFKALKIGKTTMLAQLHEINKRTGADKVVKTVSYSVDIKK